MQWCNIDHYVNLFFYYIYTYTFGGWGREQGTKDWVFHREWGMGVEALDRIMEYWGFFGGAGNYNLCWTG